MTKYVVKPSKLKGIVKIPPSKSHTLRAIVFSLMAKGKSTIREFLHASDTIAMLEAIRTLGAKVEMFPDYLEITGVNTKLNPAENVIQCGNSGQVLRFIGALAGLLNTYTIITGDRSIRHNRPVKPLLDALSQLGAFATSSRLDHYAPIIVKGPIKPGKITMPGEDSQPISGMLLLTAFAKGPSEIHVLNPGELPWIDLTLDWFKRLGIEVENNNYSLYKIPGNSSYNAFNYTVPGDFSSAAFPIAAALVTQSEITIENLDMDDVQGDKQLIYVLQKMGAEIAIDKEKRSLLVKKSLKLKGIEIDINRFIDAIVILSVIACFAEGKTIIKNASIARKKECDRIHAIANELKKMGANIEEREDGLIITPAPLSGASLETYHDHRMAMSLTVAALGAKGESTINGTKCIAKTYPEFFEHFTSIGARLKEIS